MRIIYEAEVVSISKKPKGRFVSKVSWATPYGFYEELEVGQRLEIGQRVNVIVTDEIDAEPSPEPVV